MRRSGPAAWAAALLLSGAVSVQAADTGATLAAKLARDPVPPEFRGKAKVQILDLPANERAQGLVGAILLSLPDKAYIRYFVFDTRANAERGYQRYVQEPWGSPMRRIAQEELTAQKGIAPGRATCELQLNQSTRIYAGACLHIHSKLPVLTRGTKPVKFDDRLKLEPKLQHVTEILAASEALQLASPGSLHAEKAAGR